MFFIATRHALAVAGRFSELTQITAAQLSKPSGRHRVSVRLLLLALDTKPEEDEAEGIHVRELAENLASLGHEVDLCVSRESSWTVGGGTKGLWVRPIGGGPPLSELLHVLSEARAFGPHAVYERRFLPRVSACVSLLRSVPSFVEINGLVDEEILLQGRVQKNLIPEALRTKLYSAAFRRMAKVVTVTRNLGQQMRARYRIPENQIAVIENAANNQLFRPLEKGECRRLVGIDPECYWICFEGGLHVWHGVETLVRALPLIRSQNMDAKLLIVGDGPCRRDLEALADKLGMTDFVIFTGRQPYRQVPIYIGASDVGVGPFTRTRNAKNGSSAMKMYEYVSCGRPVVVSRLPGIEDWVESEALGRLVEPDDARDLAAKICEVLRDGQLLREVTVKGPAAVARAHSWSGVSAQLIQLFQGLAG